MNENLLIKFNILNSNNEPVDIEDINLSLMLSPFYCTEGEISGEFLQQESNAYNEQIREAIFNGSLEIDTYLELIAPSFQSKPELLFKIKRDYVLCYAIYGIGNLIYLDYLKSTRKEKFLGDVKITLEYENDPTAIRDKSQSALDCMNAIKSLFNSWSGSDSMMNIFVKGQYNSSSKTSDREWWYNAPYENPVSVPIAGTKLINNRTKTLQKIGSLNASYYEQFQ